MRQRFAVASPLLFAMGVFASVVVLEPAPIDLLLVGVTGWWFVRERLEVSTNHMILAMAYLAMSAVSQSIGGINGVEFDAAVIRDLGIETYLVVTVVGLTAIFRRSPHLIRSFVTGIVLGAVAVSTLFLALKAIGRVPDLMYRDEHRLRVSGLFKDPNVLGPFLVFPILLLAFRNEVVRIPFGRVAALPCLAMLTLTYSRGAYIALLAALAVTVLFVALRESITYANAALGVTALFGALLGIAFLWSSAALPAVEVNTSRLSYQSYDDDRFSTLSSAINYMVSHPLGNGVLEFTKEHGSNPHNLFLGKATDSGIAAGLIVVLVPVFAAYRAIFAAPTTKSRFSLLVGAALIGNLTVSSVIYSHHWRHFFFLVAIATAITSATTSRDQEIDLTDKALEIRRRAQLIGQRK